MPLSRLIDCALDELREYDLDVRNPHTGALLARVTEALGDLDREIAAHAAWMGKPLRRAPLISAIDPRANRAT